MIYTAHGFHFYKGAPFCNWLFYYPVEKLLAGFTDGLVTINKEDYEAAKNFRAKKVFYVPGVGIDVDRFSDATVHREEMRRELGIGIDDFALPVSYTHLDVYKRQEEDEPRGFDHVVPETPVKELGFVQGFSTALG